MLSCPHPELILLVGTYLLFHPGSNAAKIIEFFPLTKSPQAKLRTEEAVTQVIQAPKPDISPIVKCAPTASFVAESSRLTVQTGYVHTPLPCHFSDTCVSMRWHFSL